MQNIPIALCQTGMILAKAVINPESPQGPPTCGRDVELTAPLLAKLQDKGVMHLTVKGHPVWQEGDKTEAEQLAELEFRFSQAGEDPITSLLKKVLNASIVNSMGDTNGH